MIVIKANQKINDVSSFQKVFTNGNRKFYISPAYGNCKVFHIESISSALNVTLSIDDTESLDRIEEAARYKVCFTVNVTDKRYIQKLMTRFFLVTITEVPIGYGNTFQYHCVFCHPSKLSTSNRYHQRLYDAGKNLQVKGQKNRFHIILVNGTIRRSTKVLKKHDTFQLITKYDKNKNVVSSFARPHYVKIYVHRLGKIIPLIKGDKISFTSLHVKPLVKTNYEK